MVLYVGELALVVEAFVPAPPCKAAEKLPIPGILVLLYSEQLLVSGVTRITM